jgi:hypothetical protein
MHAHRERVTITEEHEVKVSLPQDFPAGEAEVIVIADAAAPEHDLARRAVRLLERKGNAPAIALQVLVEAWVVATRPVERNGLGWPTESAAALVAAARSRFVLLIDDETTVEHLAADRCGRCDPRQACPRCPDRRLDENPWDRTHPHVQHGGLRRHRGDRGSRPTQHRLVSSPARLAPRSG